MVLEQIIDRLNQSYPPQMAEHWDNPGLQVGRRNKTVQKVFIALDATNAVIEECIEWGADLLLTHHPLIMGGIKKVSTDDYLGEKALTLAENGIAHFAMHTNYDVVKMGEMAGMLLKLTHTEVLEKTGESADGEAYGIGIVGDLPEKTTAAETCALVKKTFNLETVRLFGSAEKEIQRVAVCPGSGKSLVGEALASGAELYITGDIGHHDGIDAVDQNLLIIDAGHYGVEHIFIRQMYEWMMQQFPELEIRKAEIKHPFSVY